MRKPFYKASHQSWYVLDDRAGSPTEGKQVKLVKGPKDSTEAQAMLKWAAMQSAEQPAEPAEETPPVASGPTLGEVIDEYLAFVKAHKSPETHQSYKRYATAWKEKHGKRPAASIRPKQIRDLIQDNFAIKADGEPFSSSVKAQVEKVTLGIFAWAMDEELIDRNPVKGYKRQSTFGVRKGWITQEQFDKLLAVCDDPCFRDLLEVLWWSGARPFEIFQAEAKHFDRNKQRFTFRHQDGDKVKGKQKDRVRKFYAYGRAFEIVSRLCDQYPTGLLFRNRIEQRWRNSTTSGRATNMVKRSGVRCQETGEPPTLYHLRHSWSTLAPSRGIDISTAAKQLGHRSLKMLMEIYDHSGDDSDFMLSKLGSERAA
jgi:integrase